MTDWQSRAEKLAHEFLHPQSRWWDAVAATPRHLLVPRWFAAIEQCPDWEVRDGPADPDTWLSAAYSAAETMVTALGPLHADHAEPGTTYRGWPTSSSTNPSLVITMYRHARIYDGADVLDVGTGSGYGAALLTRRLGARHVTSVDIDPCLTATAAARFDEIGACPVIVTGDATSELPGSYDRIVPMVSLPAVPPTWLTALRPGGRLVFSLAGGSVLITADKTPDGGARGKVQPDGVSFMAARHEPGDVPLPGRDVLRDAWDADGEHVTTSPYPIVDPTLGWELDAMLSVIAPGIAHRSRTDRKTGVMTVWMAHDDGSWARATGTGAEPALVHQSGPRRLWDILDDVRRHWITHGNLPLRGARVKIDPDGTCHLSQGNWHADIGGPVPPVRGPAHNQA